MVYALTFGLGAALAGLSGALLAPTTSIAPFMGQQFVAPAFITVVVGGGTNVIAGAVGSSLLLSFVQTPIGLLLGTLSRNGCAVTHSAHHHPHSACRDFFAAPGSFPSDRGALGHTYDETRYFVSSVVPTMLAARPGSGVDLLSWRRRFCATPLVGSEFAATNVAYYLLNIPLGLGLALLWGYGGVLSFGQTAYFHHCRLRLRNRGRQHGGKRGWHCHRLVRRPL